MGMSCLNGMELNGGMDLGLDPLPGTVLSVLPVGNPKKIEGPKMKEKCKKANKGSSQFVFQFHPNFREGGRIIRPLQRTHGEGGQVQAGQGSSNNNANGETNKTKTRWQRKSKVRPRGEQELQNQRGQTEARLLLNHLTWSWINWSCVIQPKE